MNRSLNTDFSRRHGSRCAPYSYRKSHDYHRGYNSAGSYQQVYKNNYGEQASQSSPDDFIPFDTQVTSGNFRPEPYADRHTPKRWHNFRNNSYGSPQPNYNNRYSGRKFQSHNKNDKTAHRHYPISCYVDMKSITEDPWANIIERLNDSKDKDTDETTMKSESSSESLKSESLKNECSGTTIN